MRVNPRRKALFLVIAVSLATFLVAAAPQTESSKPAFWQTAKALWTIKGHHLPAKDVLDHMSKVPERHRKIPYKLSKVCEGLTKPWTPPQLAKELRDSLSAPLKSSKTLSFSKLATQIADWLDLNLYSQELNGNALRALQAKLERCQDEKLKGLELVRALSKLLESAHKELEKAISNLGPEERNLLFGHTKFCEAWYRQHFPASSKEEKATDEQKKWLNSTIKDLLAMNKVNRVKILAVGSILSQLSETKFTRSLERRLRGLKTGTSKVEGINGDVRAIFGNKPSNRIVIGGKGKTNYAAPAALIIDLGGNDHYSRAAVVDSKTMLASVVIDLAGHDQYSSNELGPAYAAGGVALLVDCEGDDLYQSKRLGQSASILGYTLLLDLKGNDHYKMEDYGQGHSLCGVSLLYDVQGNDKYEAWAFAQGGGIGYGYSALVDASGHDQYLADLHWPDVYGDSGPNIYHGASQGYCTGIRRGIAGGIAALVDLGNGKDRYQSGNFSQGGAYFYSFALMYDEGGDDENFGTRYSQGFGVHQAVGVRWDHAGNDKYTCRSVAHTGMAWDEGVGYFLEDSGNDTYKVGDLALGGAAQTGIAIFIDRFGNDNYISGKESQGATGSFEYHNKASLGVMFDLGGGKDSYTLKGRTNNHLESTNRVGIFLDSNAKSFKKLLKSKSLRKHLK